MKTYQTFLQKYTNNVAIKIKTINEDNTFTIQQYQNYWCWR